MMKISFGLIFFLSVGCNVFAQSVTNADSSLPRDTILSVNNEFEDSLILKIPVTPKQQNGFVFRGQAISIFRENIDSVLVTANTDEGTFSAYSDSLGIFRIEIPMPQKGQHIHFQLSQNDYRTFDTTFAFLPKLSQQPIHIRLIPKYKILIRGRLFAMNTPLEDVNVSIRHKDNVIQTKTLGCYFDDENYWNCLYNGMFIAEVTALNPGDSVWLTFSKPGFRIKHVGFVFSEYQGDIMNFKLKYADSIPNLGHNNINLKLGLPFSSGKDWFVGLSYYHQLHLGGFNRLAAGIESSIIVADYNSTLSTLPGEPETTVDSAYTTVFAGPSLLVWITKPDRRYFSTYAGSSFNVILNSGKFGVEPFVGTRFFLDINKSLSIEARYYTYHINVADYSFNEFGNAHRSVADKLNEHFTINFGLQINF